MIGRGQLGYLAIIVFLTIHNSIPDSTLFERQIGPGTFVIKSLPTPTATRANLSPTPPLLTSTYIYTQKETYDTNLRLYNECQVVELALRNKITDAAEQNYLSALRNAVTDIIPNNISTILTFLQTTYGRISPVELMPKEDDLKYFVYDPSQPVGTISNHADRFVNLRELVQESISDRRKVNLSYKITSKHDAFMDSLKTWNRKEGNLKTYALMKTFMRTEYNNLDEVGGLTIASSNLDQANILQELKDHQE